MNHLLSASYPPNWVLEKKRSLRWCLAVTKVSVTLDKAVSFNLNLAGVDFRTQVQIGFQPSNLPYFFTLTSPHLWFSLLFFPSLFQTPPPAQEAPASDTADLLGLNSDPETHPASSSSASAPHDGVQAGLKASSSNSDLLNDLFAPPAGHTGAVQEDLFFSGTPSGTAPAAKSKSSHLSWTIIWKIIEIAVWPKYCCK